MKKKTVVAISGSLKESSSNTAILKTIGEVASKKVDFRIYDGIGKLPFFNPDTDNENVTESVTHFRSALRQANAIIICTPEYAFGIPGVLKNALEWLVSSGEVYEKPVLTISASPGPQGGEKAHEALRLTLSALGAKLREDGKLTIPSLRSKMDQQNRIINETLLADLEDLVNKLIQQL